MNRSDFPIFEAHPQLCYLDSAATAQKPRAVLEAMFGFYSGAYASPLRGVYDLSSEATTAMEKARLRVARFLGARSADQIIFTKNTTEAINLVAHAFEGELKAGEGVAVTRVEHHANFLPWQRLAQRSDADFYVVDCDDHGVVHEESLERIPEGTRLIAHALHSNVTGQRLPVEDFRKAASRLGAKVLIDAAQTAAHHRVDVEALGCDFLVFSGHKVYAPNGVGVLYAKDPGVLEPLLLGGGMVAKVRDEGYLPLPPPQKLEAGTPDLPSILGLSRAMDYLESIGFEAIEAHENALYQTLKEALSAFEERGALRLIGKGAKVQGGIVSFAPLSGVHAHDLASFLAARGVAVRAGHHCAMPLKTRIGECATLRVSLGIYNDEGDIERLKTALSDGLAFFGRADG